MPRNTWRSPSRLPRTRPLVVRTTGPPAACASGLAAARQIADAPRPSNPRRWPSTFSGSGFCIVDCPVLNQRGPRGHVATRDASQAESMTATVEHVEFTAHLLLAQRVVHEQRI